MALDELDNLAAKAFEGFIVRKDLARKFKGLYPVPNYVAEFLLGRYCASTDPAEINEGLEIVQKQMESRTVRAGTEELFKAKAKNDGRVKLIDIIRAKLDAANGWHDAEIPSLGLKDVRIDDELVNKHQRMLTGGFYAEIELTYDRTISEESDGRPFGILSLREIQVSKSDALDTLIEGRKEFTFEQWKDFLIRSIGMEPTALTERMKDVILLRMVPYVELNFNSVELGPRGTGKSHIYQQISPYSHLVSGGKASIARMFVNNATGAKGLVCQYDVVCFDEVSGISFDSKDGVNIMKGYMESGEFSRGKDSIRGFGSMVLVGNFDVDVTHQQRVSHLFGPLPKEMRDDTAFMDRLHCYLPGWDMPKMSKELLTDHFGLVSDFLALCWNSLRQHNRKQKFGDKIHLGAALSGRDANSVEKTMNGLLKLMFPDGSADMPEEAIEWAARLALECRRRVKEQQKRLVPTEYRNTQFSYHMGGEGVEKFVGTPELHQENSISDDPLPPGQVWVMSPGGTDEAPGLFRIDVTVGPGSSVRLLNQPAPPPLKESVRCAEQNMYARAKELVGDRDPRSHEFSVQARAFDGNKSGSGTGLGVLLGLSSGLLEKSLKGGLVVVGSLNLGGSIETIFNPVAVVEAAADKGAKVILMPISTRRQLVDLPDEVATRVVISHYSDAKDALIKALG